MTAYFGGRPCDFSAESGALEAQPAASITSNGQERPEQALTCRPHIAKFWLRLFHRGIRIYHRLIPGGVGESAADRTLVCIPGNKRQLYQAKSFTDPLRSTSIPELPVPVDLLAALVQTF